MRSLKSRAMVMDRLIGICMCICSLILVSFFFFFFLLFHGGRKRRYVEVEIESGKSYFRILNDGIVLGICKGICCINCYGVSEKLRIP